MALLPQYVNTCVCVIFPTKAVNTLTIEPGSWAVGRTSGSGYCVAMALALPPDISPSALDALSDRAWPARDRLEHEGWSLRFSAGVTNRANSVLPAGAVFDLSAAVDVAEVEYRTRHLPPVFQLSEAASPDLADELRIRGYRQHSHTTVMVASLDRIAGWSPSGSATRVTVTAHRAAPVESVPTISIEDRPDAEWMDLWWSVDGRGGAAERAVVLDILGGVTALYGSVRDADSGTVVAVARIALVDDWAGLYSVATRPDARRRGHARALIVALAAAAQTHGASNAWLQVLADNSSAHDLYRVLGFVQASSYSYWSAPDV